MPGTISTRAEASRRFLAFLSESLSTASYPNQDHFRMVSRGVVPGSDCMGGRLSQSGHGGHGEPGEKLRSTTEAKSTGRAQRRAPGSDWSSHLRPGFLFRDGYRGLVSPSNSPLWRCFSPMPAVALCILRALCLLCASLSSLWFSVSPCSPRITSDPAVPDELNSAPDPIYL